MAALGGVLNSRQVFAQFEGMRVSSPAGSLRQCRAAMPAQRRCQHSRMTVTARQGEVGVGMFGTKAGMTQIFTADGLALPATVIALEQGNVVTQIKTTETDGYNAVQVGACATADAVLPRTLGVLRQPLATLHRRPYSWTTTLLHDTW